MTDTGLFYHEYVPVTVRVAQAVGLTASAYLCGHTAAASYVLVPTILESPAPLLARQWRKGFDIAKLVTGPLSLACGVTFGALAYREGQGSSTFKFLTAAALLIPSTVPYSIAMMQPVNKKLNDKAESYMTTEITDTAAESGVAKEETVHALVDKWATLNMGNALLVGVGALCAAWSMVESVEVVGLQFLGLRSGANRLG